MTFNPENLADLPESKHDQKRLTEVFTKLGFTVKPHQNLNGSDMRAELEGYTKMDREEMEKYKGKALIVIILSHGGEGDVVYGTDGLGVHLHELQELFSATNCRYLERAPKVFLIDACRGGNPEQGYSNNKNEKHGGTAKSSGVITDSLNFATVFASTRGNAAYVYKEGDEKKGSYFTQTLADVIEEADKDKELNEIVTEVRLRILQKAEEKLLKLNAQDPQMKERGKGPEQEVMAQDPEQEVKGQDPKQEVEVQDPEQEVKAQDPEQEVNVQDPEQEVKAKGPEQEVMAQDPEQEVKAQDPEQEVKAQDPEQEVMAQDPEQEVMAQDPEQEVKAQDPEQEVMAQDPEQEVMAQDPEQEVKAKDSEQEVKAKGQKGKETTTQTVQYNSTLVKLYYIKRNSNK